MTNKAYLKFKRKAIKTIGGITLFGGLGFLGMEAPHYISERIHNDHELTQVLREEAPKLGFAAEDIKVKIGGFN